MTAPSPGTAFPVPPLQSYGNASICGGRVKSQHRFSLCGDYISHKSLLLPTGFVLFRGAQHYITASSALTGGGRGFLLSRSVTATSPENVQCLVYLSPLPPHWQARRGTTAAVLAVCEWLQHVRYCQIQPGLCSCTVPWTQATHSPYQKPLVPKGATGEPVEEINYQT